MNGFLKTDYTTLKNNSEVLNLKFAESKVLEANLNIEMSQMKKDLNILKKEIGLWEMKFEQKDQDFNGLRVNLETQKNLLKESEKKVQDLSKELEALKENKLMLEGKFKVLKQQNESLEENNEHLRGEIDELNEVIKKNQEEILETKNSFEKSIEKLLQESEKKNEELKQSIEEANKEIFEYKHILTMNNLEKDNKMMDRKIDYNIPNQKNNTFKKIENRSNQKGKEVNKNPNFQDLNANNNDEKSKNNIQINKKAMETKPNQKIFYEDEENQFSDLNSQTRYTQTELIEGDEMLKEYLRNKNIFPIIWPDIFEAIETISKRNPQIFFDPKKSSRKNSLTELLKGNSLSPSNKFQYYYEGNNDILTTKNTDFHNSQNSNDSGNNLLGNLDKNLINIQENSEYKNSKKLQILTSPQNAHTSPNSVKLINIQNNKNNQISQSDLKQSPQIISMANQNGKALSNLTTGLLANLQSPSNIPKSAKFIQNSNGFASASALKYHLKGSSPVNNALAFSQQRVKGGDSFQIPQKINSYRNDSANKIENEVLKNPSKYKKERHLSASSSNLNLLINDAIRVEDQDKVNERSNLDLWELSKEEKENIYEEMYKSLSIQQEKLLLSQKDHKKFLRHVALIKHIKKEVNGDFNGDFQVPNLDEFKEFMERMLNQHKKCGKDCSHLKRFYEKIGWLQGEKASAYANRVPYNPKKMIISSLPKIP